MIDRCRVVKVSVGTLETYKGVKCRVRMIFKLSIVF